MPIIRKCRVCGKEFETNQWAIDHNYGKVCSRECQYLLMRKTIKRICLYCGKEFESWESYVKRGSGKYCSIACRGNARRTKIKKICKKCGKVFFTHPNRIKIGQGNYCSRLCARSDKRNAVDKICLICGKPFKARAQQIKTGGGNYCSIKCFNKSDRNKKTKDRNPMWNNGSSCLPYCQRWTSDLRERVRIFFNYRCVNCGKTQEENGQKLNVHHVNYDKMVCCNDVKPLFVALCISCHMKSNYNREKWERIFTELIMTKFGGKCFLPKGEL